MSSNAADAKKIEEAMWAIQNDFFELRRSTETVINRRELIILIQDRVQPVEKQKMIAGLNPKQKELLDNIQKNVKIYSKHPDLKPFSSLGLSAEAIAFDHILHIYERNRKIVSAILKSLLVRIPFLNPTNDLKNTLNINKENLKKYLNNTDYQKLIDAYDHAQEIVEYDIQDEYNKLVNEGKIKPSVPTPPMVPSVESKKEQPKPNIASNTVPTAIPAATPQRFTPRPPPPRAKNVPVTPTPNIPEKQQQSTNAVKPLTTVKPGKGPNVPTSVTSKSQSSNLSSNIAQPQPVMPQKFETKSNVEGGIAEKIRALNKSSIKQSNTGGAGQNANLVIPQQSSQDRNRNKLPLAPVPKQPEPRIPPTPATPKGRSPKS